MSGIIAYSRSLTHHSTLIHHQLPSSQDYTHALQQMMQRVGVSSYKALSQQAGVSEKQIRKLRRGEIEQMRVDVLLKLSQALEVSFWELIATYSAIAPNVKVAPNENLPPIAELKREYDRLQAELAKQKQELRKEFQLASLQAIESWLLQWPTAAQKAKENPELAAVKLLPLVKPIEQLLQQWDVEAIAPVGAEVEYDPQLHQLLSGSAQPRETVVVRYTGYRQGDKLLYRAKVSPMQGMSEGTRETRETREKL
ncbi:helix-turn-helix domain-containing protein [Chroococcidiopsis sp [FACHB-1243]]|uniref:helix-turn-helix domain-containing protein n=1 Tax=Chroococcidiopsis sp. [FACHB-1243] TaxID=2692781 RepID=UPI0018F0084A|nr:helix-turn-helix domain-containing protein [Chroococcidiopsis sp. [FACHB-1243]]